MTIHRPRHPFSKSFKGPRRDNMRMGAQTPTAAGNSAPLTASGTFTELSGPTVGGTSATKDLAGSTCCRTNLSSEIAPHGEGRHDLQRRCPTERDGSSPRSMCGDSKTVQEHLADLLADMMKERGEELGDAFLSAAIAPPMTKQSLSELDIPNIITNIKLRHDINFDRGLSFRPNMDGPKGQEKMRQSQAYWQALVAELEIYVRLFQGTPVPWGLEHVDWAHVIQHAEKRIPTMFETIHDVLKSMVPERDYARVDEHLDVAMLMTQIERGVCDLVKLAEWLAYLLKEHCAPVRDAAVDKMVEMTRSGVVENRCDWIVSGLKELLGILEAMKLDVANHQIRNLKTLLIDDTVNFENHYHLDRLVNKRARVNLETAKKWYAVASDVHRQQVTPTPRDISRFQFEIFARAVVSDLTKDARSDLPDTFYLDQDRIRVLRSEIDDLVHFEICFNIFSQLLSESGYNGTVWPSTRQHLQKTIISILGDGGVHASQSWILNSESISIELYRQALTLARRQPLYHDHDLQNVTQRLREAFSKTYLTHAAALETTFLPQVLACCNRYYNSSPIELFNDLVAPTQPPPPGPFPSLALIPNTLSSPSVDRLTDLSNRLTHILLLHWRIWGRIAYIQGEESESKTPSTSQSAILPPAPTPPPAAVSITPPPHTTRPPSAASSVDAQVQVPDSMMTGEPPEPGEARVSRGARLP